MGNFFFRKQNKRTTKQEKPTDLSVQQNKSEYDHLFKFLLVGDTCVGKSSILLRFSDNIFSSENFTSLGVDFKIKNMIINDSMTRFQIWDTAGQERFRTITSSYYRGAQGIIIVFDVTDYGSFLNVSKWFQEIGRYCREDVKKVLIGNKIDLVNDRKVSYEEAKKLSDEYGLLYLETSAKNSQNISFTFEYLATSIMESSE